MIGYGQKCERVELNWFFFVEEFVMMDGMVVSFVIESGKEGRNTAQDTFIDL